MADWKLYETQILRKLAAEFPTADLVINVKRKGQFSKVPRQIDILCVERSLGYEHIGIVECKYFNKNIDVKVIESFIGFLEDVNANWGLIITNKGYSVAAKSRSKSKTIHLDVVEFEKLESYSFEWDQCECGHEVLWDEKLSIPKYHVNASFGHCSYCGELYFECEKCGHIQHIHEGFFGTIFECSCKRNHTYRVDQEYIGSGQNDEFLFLVLKTKEIQFEVKPKKLRLL